MAALMMTVTTSQRRTLQLLVVKVIHLIRVTWMMLMVHLIRTINCLSQLPIVLSPDASADDGGDESESVSTAESEVAPACRRYRTADLHVIDLTDDGTQPMGPATPALDSTKPAGCKRLCKRS